MKLAEFYHELQKISQTNLVEKYYTVKKDGEPFCGIKFNIKKDSYSFAFNFEKNYMVYIHTNIDTDLYKKQSHVFPKESGIDKWAMPFMWKLTHAIEVDVP